MNADDFEQRLQRQSWRRIPAGWRGEILAGADAVRRTQPVRELTFAAALRSRLQAWLWPCPSAWAGLALVWVIIIAVNGSLRDKAETMARQATPSSPEVISAIRQREGLLAELIGPTEPREAERPRPQPRSERCGEMTTA